MAPHEERRGLSPNQVIEPNTQAQSERGVANQEEQRLEVIRSITRLYWARFQQTDAPAVVFTEFCQALERSGAISLDVIGDPCPVAVPSLYISNHVTVLESLKIFVNGTYAVPYHSLLLDYLIERHSGRAVSHISTNPHSISPVLEHVARRLGFLLIEKEISPRGWVALKRQVAEILAGRHVSLAPEGHFHAWDSVGPFKKGFYHWARENSAPIIPVKLAGFATLGPKLEFTFGKPEIASAAADPDNFVNEIRERVFGDEFGLRLL